MFQKTSDSCSASTKRGALPLVGQHTPDRVLVAYKCISSLPIIPVISRTQHGRGRDYYRVRFGRGRRNRRSLYLGHLDDRSHQLLTDWITSRYPKALILELTCERNDLRRKAVELAIGSGFRFRGHEVERRKPVKPPDKNLPELLATLRRLMEVDGRLHQRLTSSLPVLSPRVAKRTCATLRMFSRAMPLTGGLSGLRGALGIGTVSLDELVDQELTRRVMSGRMRTGDLVRLQANAIMGRRIVLENRDPDAPMRESMEFMQHLMSAFAPRMKSTELTPEAVEASDSAIRARLEAQKLATGIGVTRDAGGEKRLDGILKKV